LLPERWRRRSAIARAWSAGEGLGYGLGASIGAALALQGTGRIVIDLQGDGDMLYTPQALWTAAHHHIPLLVIVEANGSYYRDVEHQRSIAVRRGRPRADVGPGLVFDEPAIDFAQMSRSMGIESVSVDGDEASLVEALRAAITTVDAGEPAVVVVPVEGFR
jgi:acetolactate synthase-1/2/3 large subunit